MNMVFENKLRGPTMPMFVITGSTNYSIEMV